MIFIFRFDFELSVLFFSGRKLFLYFFLSIFISSFLSFLYWCFWPLEPINLSSQRSHTRLNLYCFSILHGGGYFLCTFRRSLCIFWCPWDFWIQIILYLFLWLLIHTFDTKTKFIGIPISCRSNSYFISPNLGFIPIPKYYLHPWILPS